MALCLAEAVCCVPAVHAEADAPDFADVEAPEVCAAVWAVAAAVPVGAFGHDQVCVAATAAAADVALDVTSDLASDVGAAAVAAAAVTPDMVGAAAVAAAAAAAAVANDVPAAAAAVPAVVTPADGQAGLV